MDKTCGFVSSNHTYNKLVLAIEIISYSFAGRDLKGWLVNLCVNRVRNILTFDSLLFHLPYSVRSHSDRCYIGLDKPLLDFWRHCNVVQWYPATDALNVVILLVCHNPDIIKSNQSGFFVRMLSGENFMVNRTNIIRVSIKASRVMSYLAVWSLDVVYPALKPVVGKNSDLSAISL